MANWTSPENIEAVASENYSRNGEKAEPSPALVRSIEAGYDETYPLIVREVNGKLRLISGFHRHAAASAAGVEVAYEVVEATDDEALAMNWRANLRTKEVGVHPVPAKLWAEMACGRFRAGSREADLKDLLGADRNTLQFLSRTGAYWAATRHAGGEKVSKAEKALDGDKQALNLWRKMNAPEAGFAATVAASASKSKTTRTAAEKVLVEMVASTDWGTATIADKQLQEAARAVGKVAEDDRDAAIALGEAATIPGALVTYLEAPDKVERLECIITEAKLLLEAGDAAGALAKLKEV